MGRPTRFFVPGISVHLIQRGNNRSKAFDDESDYCSMYVKYTAWLACPIASQSRNRTLNR